MHLWRFGLLARLGETGICEQRVDVERLTVMDFDVRY